MKTIDEILISNGITSLTGKMHDGIIAAMNEYAMQDKEEMDKEILRRDQLNKTVCDNISKACDATVIRCNVSFYKWQKEKQEIMSKLYSDSSDIKGALVSFFRNGTKGDYLEALNKAIVEISCLSSNKVAVVAFVKWVHTIKNDSPFMKALLDHQNGTITTEQFYDCYLNRDKK